MELDSLTSALFNPFLNSKQESEGDPLVCPHCNQDVGGD